MDGNATAMDVMTRGIKRPCPMPLSISQLAEPSTIQEVEQRISQRALSSTGLEFLKVVKTTTVQSWQEGGEAEWKQWKSDVQILNLLQEQTEFRGTAQILADIFFNKAPQTLAKRVNSSRRITKGLHLRRLFLPITAPGLGVTETAWRPRWLKAREELDIVT